MLRTPGSRFQSGHRLSGAASRYGMSYQRAFNLQVPPEQVWQAIQHVERFQDWWGWLTELRLDGPRLEPGMTLTGVISPPLPYRMSVRLVFETCVPPSLIRGVVHGDLEGVAELRLSPDAGGTRAAVAWTFEMMQPAMRLAALVAYPVLRWGHDRIVESTVADFHRHLEQGAGRPEK
jgi:carbon monoxide dehydrogenase subunit G